MFGRRLLHIVFQRDFASAERTRRVVPQPLVDTARTATHEFFALVTFTEENDTKQYELEEVLARERDDMIPNAVVQLADRAFLVRFIRRAQGKWQLVANLHWQTPATSQRGSMYHVVSIPHMTYFSSKSGLKHSKSGLLLASLQSYSIS